MKCASKLCYEIKFSSQVQFHANETHFRVKSVFQLARNTGNTLLFNLSTRGKFGWLITRLVPSIIKMFAFNSLQTSAVSITFLTD